jgi:hypothetical protein
MKLFLSLAAIILCAGCTNEIEIDPIPYESSVTVDGWIETGQPAYVFLTQSSPFLTNYDSLSIRNTFLNYAKVTLSNHKGEEEILTLTRRDEFFPPFVYKSLDIKGEEGGLYDLRIEVEGKVITSQTTIPSMPDVKGIFPVLQSDTTYMPEVLFQDDVSVENYYYIEIKIQDEDTKFHSSSFPLYSDMGFNGESVKIKVNRSVQPDPLNIYNINSKRNLPEYEFGIEDKIFMKFSCVDKNSYSVLNDIYVDQLNYSNPFSFVNKKTATNINGGIGRWTGMASKSYYVYYLQN